MSSCICISSFGPTTASDGLMKTGGVVGHTYLDSSLICWETKSYEYPLEPRPHALGSSDQYRRLWVLALLDTIIVTVGEITELHTERISPC